MGLRLDLVVDVSRAEPARGMAAARHPALERMVARGEPIELARPDAGEHGLGPVLKALFGVPAEHALPGAALSLLDDGIDPGESDWLRLDPVHLRAARAHLVLVPLSEGDIAPAEAEAAHAALAPHFAQDGFELVRGRSGRWYLRLPTGFDVQTHSPADCTGALAEPLLPGGRDGPALRRLVTEAQMLLYGLPMNEAREAAGKLAFNAVWPWGNGRVPQLPRSRYTHVLSADPVVRGLGIAAGATAGDAPHDAAGMQARYAAEASVLAVPAASTPVGDIERNWAEPLAGQLAQGAIETLELVLIGASDTVARIVTRRQMRRWWRRPRPLAHA